MANMYQMPTEDVAAQNFGVKFAGMGDNVQDAMAPNASLNGNYGSQSNDTNFQELLQNMPQTASQPSAQPVAQIPGQPAPLSATPNVTGNLPINDPNAYVKQLAEQHPELANSPSGFQALQMLANKIVKGDAPGGDTSTEARIQAENNLAPINASNAFFGKVMNANGIGSTSQADNQSNFANDFDVHKASTQADLGNVGNAVSTQMQMATMQQLSNPDSPASKVYMEVAQRIFGGKLPEGTTPGQLFGVLPPSQIMTMLTTAMNNNKTMAETQASLASAQKSNADTVKTNTDTQAMTNPKTGKPYTPADKAEEQKQGEFRAATKENLINDNTRLPFLEQTLDKMEKINQQTPQGVTATYAQTIENFTPDWVEGGLQSVKSLVGADKGNTANQNSRLVAQFDINGKQLLINEVQGMLTDAKSSGASIRLTDALQDLNHAASGIDISASPAARQEQMDAVRTKIRSLRDIAKEKYNLAVEDKTSSNTPATNTQNANTSGSVTKNINGKTYTKVPGGWIPAQ